MEMVWNVGILPVVFIGWLMLLIQEVIRLVSTMVTTMSIRTRKGIYFELTEDDPLDAVLWTSHGRRLRGVVQHMSKPRDAAAA